MSRLLAGSGFLRFRKAQASEIPLAPVDRRQMTAMADAEPAEYVGARTEARSVCRNLGLDVENMHWEVASIGDFVRLAYAQYKVPHEVTLRMVGVQFVATCSCNPDYQEEWLL